MNATFCTLCEVGRFCPLTNGSRNAFCFPGTFSVAGSLACSVRKVSLFGADSFKLHFPPRFAVLSPVFFFVLSRIYLFPITLYHLNSGLSCWYIPIWFRIWWVLSVSVWDLHDEPSIIFMLGMSSRTSLSVLIPSSTPMPLWLYFRGKFNVLCSMPKWYLFFSLSVSFFSCHKYLYISYFLLFVKIHIYHTNE